MSLPEPITQSGELGLSYPTNRVTPGASAQLSSPSAGAFRVEGFIPLPLEAGAQQVTTSTPHAQADIGGVNPGTTPGTTSETAPQTTPKSTTETVAEIPLVHHTERCIEQESQTASQSTGVSHDPNSELLRHPLADRFSDFNALEALWHEAAALQNGLSAVESRADFGYRVQQLLGSVVQLSTSAIAEATPSAAEATPLALPATNSPAQTFTPRSEPAQDVATTLLLLRAQVALLGGRQALREGSGEATVRWQACVTAAHHAIWCATQQSPVPAEALAQVLWALEDLQTQMKERRAFLLQMTSADPACSGQEKPQALQLQSAVMDLSALLQKQHFCLDQTHQGMPIALPVLRDALGAADRLGGQLQAVRAQANSTDVGLELWDDADSDESFFVDDMRQKFYENVAAELNNTRQELHNAYVQQTADHLYDAVNGLEGASTLTEFGGAEALQQLLDCAKQLRRSRETGTLHYNVEQRFEEVNQLITEALSVRAQDAQVWVGGLLQALLDQCPIDLLERDRIIETLNLLPCLMQDWGTLAQQNAHELVNLAHNGGVLFRGLLKQTQQVMNSPDLSAEAKRQVSSWLCRLAENESALMSGDRQAASDFVAATTQVVAALISRDVFGDRLVNHLMVAAHDRACTDWASAVLIELSAVIDSARLEQSLTQLRQRAQSPEARWGLAVNFVRAQATQIKALMRYSAFKAFMMASAHAKAQHKEGVQQALYLYTHLQSRFELPGNSVANRMDFADYTEQAFGKTALAQAVEEAHHALQLADEGDSDHKALLLENLALFGVGIWDELKSLLPTAALSDSVLTEEQEPITLELCERKIAEILNAASAFDPDSPKDAAQLVALHAHHARWAERRAALEQVGPEASAVTQLVAWL
jgi:hypothetical protein